MVICFIYVNDEAEIINTSSGFASLNHLPLKGKANAPHFLVAGG